jgi:GH18 family chitinase
VIGYYESWASSRSCDSWSPSSLAVNGLTHLNYAFATFYETEDHYYMFAFMDGAEEPAVLVKEFMELKENNPGLSLYLSIGGWSFNDGDTASYWSDMASTSTGRYRFAQALLQFLDTYGFDGVDLDWEYPVADDRGGKAEDKDNYVALIKEIRFYFDLSGNQYGLTFTTPASYWYLQNFDVPGMLEAGADWTNIMTYDLHGVWDGDDPSVEAPVWKAVLVLTESVHQMDRQSGRGPH